MTRRYTALVEAMLTVAIYSEDGKQLLLSASTKVDPDKTEVELVLDGTMPQYFMASAYLMDTFDLCFFC